MDECLAKDMAEYTALHLLLSTGETETMGVQRNGDWPRVTLVEPR